MVEDVQEVAHRSVARLEPLAHEPCVLQWKDAQGADQPHEVDPHEWGAVPSRLQRLDFTRRESQRHVGAEPNDLFGRGGKTAHRLSSLRQALQQADGLEEPIDVGLAVKRGFHGSGI